MVFAWHLPEWGALLLIAVFAICQFMRTVRSCRGRPIRPTMPSASCSPPA
ncbi:hypothetical protein [Breoghania sp.]|nr:hypothetical protein [Breoghania sp.]MDJ0931127.1 hypothetical protein [Breoghania sp.]